MASHDSQKRYFAWEVLKRSPDHQSFWDDFCLAKQDVSKRHQKMSLRTKLRGDSIGSRKIMREFNIRAQERWCLTKIYNPEPVLTSQQEKELFAPIRPVTEFYCAPWEGDPRLYIPIDPHGSLKEIKRQVLLSESERKNSLQIPVRESLGLFYSSREISFGDIQVFRTIYELRAFEVA